MDLVEVSSSAGITRLPVRGDVVRIGRDVDNDVVLADQPAASRHHAELHRADGGWIVRDLGSRNGTWVDGQRLTAEVVLGERAASVAEVAIRIVDAPDPGLTEEGAGPSADLARAETLSAREREVIALVAGGRTDDQIARELYISVKTVHSHLDKVRDKTGVRRRAELTRLALRLGLAAPPAAGRGR